MQKIKYRIYRLSARTVMGYGQQDGDWFSFSLNRSATEHCKLYDLLCDFRNGGYRILGHLVGDCIAAYREKARKELHSPKDSPAMVAMLSAYKNRASSADFETVVAQECRNQLEKIMEPGQAVKYAVALNCQDFLWDVLYDVIIPYVRKQEVSRNA